MSEEQIQQPLETVTENLNEEVNLDSTEDIASPPEESSPVVLSPEEVIIQLKQELENLQEQFQEQEQAAETAKKRYITLAAEFDNYRKRTLKEKEELERQIKAKTITELLPIVDNFERARTQIKPNTDGEQGIHKSYQGVYKTLVDSLKRLGVTAMRPEGQMFDPNYHEAMLREYTNEHPEGTILEQLVRGYLLEDLVLRHAMVKVAAPQEFTEEASESPADDQAQEAT
jgi:molecular chaperone GrpE